MIGQLDPPKGAPPPIVVRSTGRPPWGAHWSYGANYMQRVSKASALKLLRASEYDVPESALPRMGYERGLKLPGGYMTGLYVQNISGAYYLASTFMHVEGWPGYFGVEVKGKKT